MQCYNKVDTVSLEEVDRLARLPYSVVISCELELNFDTLLYLIWEYLSLLRVYTKKRGGRMDSLKSLKMEALRVLFVQKCPLFRGAFKVVFGQNQLSFLEIYILYILYLEGNFHCKTMPCLEVCKVFCGHVLCTQDVAMYTYPGQVRHLYIPG